MPAKIEYPTINGIPMSPQDIDLPESELKLNRPWNKHLHHDCWPKAAFTKNALFKAVRDLASHQTNMPIDTHVYLHKRYLAPKPPTPEQALIEIQRAFKDGEERQYKKGGIIIRRKLGKKTLKQIMECYEEIKDKNPEEIYYQQGDNQSPFLLVVNKSVQLRIFDIAE